MGSEGAHRAGDVVASLFGGAAGKRLSEASRAARAWYAANGDRERSHTTGVWLRASGRDGVDPVMVVGVDSSLLALELGTNKEIYLARLAWAGIAVSDIRFVPRKRSDAAVRAAKAAERETPPLPELTPAERDRVAKATSGLPDGLKESVSRAMCATLRRNRSNHTR